jgi:hypothetical protein
LPSWIAASLGSLPIAAAMSVIIDVVWLKMSLPLPPSFLMFLNVRRRFAPDWIASSSMPTLLLIAVARLPT